MKYFVVDAFASKLFSGNPAGVCLMENKLIDSQMQQIAFENNLSDTAFVWQENGEYYLRWFTPKEEIPLCGHATLGTGFVLLELLKLAQEEISFQTQSGVVTVSKKGEKLWLDFPVKKINLCEKPSILEDALGCKVKETYSARNLIAVVQDEATVANLLPNFNLLKQIDHIHGIVVTAPGKACDFVSRFFVPNTGINEDPVTGSTHTELMPYWTERLGKNHLQAQQLSERGGELECVLVEDRVQIGGRAVLYLSGEIYLS